MADKELTWGELRIKLEHATPEQLAAPVRWWGEERGGIVKCLHITRVRMVLTDDGYEDEGSAPRDACEECHGAGGFHHTGAVTATGVAVSVPLCVRCDGTGEEPGLPAPSKDDIPAGTLILSVD